MGGSVMCDTKSGAPSFGAGVTRNPSTAPQQRSLLGRVTLTGALIAVAVMSGIYAAAFSAYWLILTLFALGGATQTWSFDLAASKPPTQAE